MRIEYIEANAPRDLAAAVNAVTGVEVVNFIVHGNRVGAFVKVPDDFVPVTKAPPTRPKAALEYEAKMKAQAKAEALAAKAEAEFVGSEAVAGSGKAPKSANKKNGGKVPGPVVE